MYVLTQFKGIKERMRNGRKTFIRVSSANKPFSVEIGFMTSLEENHLPDPVLRWVVCSLCTLQGEYWLLATLHHHSSLLVIVLTFHLRLGCQYC
jgi:hypothetical protein